MGHMVTVRTWGGQGVGKALSGEGLRVRVSEDRSALDAALAQIERRAQTHVACISPQGTSLSHGKPESNHYQITLGHPVSRRYGGGMSVDGVIWIAVPCARCLAKLEC